MKKDEIIRMAREAGLFTHKEVQPELECFANLVAAHKAEIVLAEAYRCGYEAGVVAEREACENAVEDVARKYQKLHHASLENIADECAAAIRERSGE